MRWAVLCKNSETIEEDAGAAIEEAATYGREVAAAVFAPGHGVLLIFRPIPRGGPAHVTATLVDRNGYPR